MDVDQELSGGKKKSFSNGNPPGSICKLRCPTKFLMECESDSLRIPYGNWPRDLQTNSYWFERKSWRIPYGNWPSDQQINFLLILKWVPWEFPKEFPKQVSTNSDVSKISRKWWRHQYGAYGDFHHIDDVISGKFCWRQNLVKLDSIVVIFLISF